MAKALLPATDVIFHAIYREHHVVARTHVGAKTSTALRQRAGFLRSRSRHYRFARQLPVLLVLLMLLLLLLLLLLLMLLLLLCCLHDHLVVHLRVALALLLRM